jgi:putative transposase
VQAETKRLIAECCQRHGLTLLALETDVDHIHGFVSAPPRLSPANLLKGYSSGFLREKFPHLKKVCGKEHLWTQSYDVGTAGAVSAETIKRYMTQCQGKESGLAFIPPPRTGRDFPLPLLNIFQP